MFAVAGSAARAARGLAVRAIAARRAAALDLAAGVFEGLGARIRGLGRGLPPAREWGMFPHP